MTHEDGHDGQDRFVAPTYWGHRLAVGAKRILDQVATGSAEITAFLRSLLDDPDTLPLVEITAKNSGLIGGPKLRLSDPENASLAPVLRQFAAAFTDLLARIEDIESVKVYVFNKRVRIRFEPVSTQPGHFIVRYADQHLNGAQRRAFEQRMESDYAITVLPIEEKHAR